MRYITAICVLAFLVAGMLAAIPASADIIYANADTFTNQQAANTVQGPGISVKGQTGYVRYGWLEYTFGSELVTEATLNMYQVAMWRDSYKVDFRAGEATIDEGTMTWNNGHPAGHNDWEYIGQWTAPTANTWYALDITDFYNNNLGKTIVFRLSSPDKGSQQGGTYEDREGGRGSGNPHYISFTAAPVPEPASMLALAGGIFGMAGAALRRRR